MQAIGAAIACLYLPDVQGCLPTSCSCLQGVFCDVVRCRVSIDAKQRMHFWVRPDEGCRVASSPQGAIHKGLQ